MSIQQLKKQLERKRAKAALDAARAELEGLKAQKAEAEKEKAKKAKASKPKKPRAKRAKKAEPGFNSTNVLDWFHVALKEMYGEATERPEWRAKERTLAKNLLTRYGPEKTEEAVGLFVAEWELMVYESGQRLKGVPTVNMLYAMRTQIFGELDRRASGKIIKPKAQADEYDDRFEPEGMGW